MVAYYRGFELEAHHMGRLVWREFSPHAGPELMAELLRQLTERFPVGVHLVAVPIVEVMDGREEEFQESADEKSF